MLCRWMSDPDTGNTIFVGNASTGEIYELNGLSPEWRVDPKVINTNSRQMSVNCDSSFDSFDSIQEACFNLDIYNISDRMALKKG